MIKMLRIKNFLLVLLLIISIGCHSQQSPDNNESAIEQINIIPAIADQINFLEDLEKLIGQVDALAGHEHLKESPQSKTTKDAEGILDNTSIRLNELKMACKERLSVEINDKCGGFSFINGDNSFIAFIADPKKHSLRIHGQGESIIGERKVPFNTLSSIQKKLALEQQDVLMLTNGGMFTNSYNAEGLLIIDSQEISAIDTGNSEQFLNFYFKPNGIFYIENDEFKISETMNFLQACAAGDINPVFATQSGPMLLLDDKIHDGFNQDSQSKKIRSGVGVLDNGKAIFIVSQTELTFYDFANLFQSLFSVKDALFLDGAISKIYVKDLIGSGMGHKFGPIVSVSAKKR